MASTSLNLPLGSSHTGLFHHNDILFVFIIQAILQLVHDSMGETLTTMGEPTGQQVPLSEDQVCNSAGGYVWPVSDMNRLRRFMVLGSESGSYYIQSKELGLENIICIQTLIESGYGENVVKEIVDFSVGGRTSKQGPILLALVQCARCSDLKTKQAAYEALSRVCRIPTHLFQFIEYSEKFSDGTGWGRAQRRAISKWYNKKKPSELAYQITKYRNRNGWSHKDVLRLAHVKPEGDGK